jgi:hypothetical protein
LNRTSKVNPNTGGAGSLQEECRRRFPFRRIGILFFLVILLSVIGAMIVIENAPYAGAQAAIRMRSLFGPQVVAGLETIVFQVQDAWRGWRYQLGSFESEAPWQAAPPQVRLQINDQEPPATAAATNHQPVFLTSTPTPDSTDQQIISGEQLTELPNPTPTPYLWQLPTLLPFGSLEGEGIWQPYLYDLDGNIVAQRTFLQPDPERPYAVVAIVAFDLNRTRLNFVLGFNEPSVPDGPRGDGLIPEADRQPGILLAAFNGGFRAANGHFGAMADGVVALPPKDDFATVGIYQRGEVRIGNWGEEISDTPDLKAWRQNCSLIIQDGEISPKVYSNSITDWGASISNQIVTRRSGLGLNQSGKTLYYFAGPDLSMPVLAETMLAVGVHDGMLLDINHFWVHFTAIHALEGALVAEPLLPDDMIDHIDRYLNPSPVDFFYITVLDRNP